MDNVIHAVAMVAICATTAILVILLGGTYLDKKYQEVTYMCTNGDILFGASRVNGEYVSIIIEEDSQVCKDKAELEKYTVASRKLELKLRVKDNITVGDIK